MASFAHCGCPAQSAASAPQQRARLWSVQDGSPAVASLSAARSLHTRSRRPHRICTCAAKRGRPPKQAVAETDEISIVEFGKPGGKVETVEDREAQREEIYGRDDELADWTQKVVDWSEFMEDSPTAGFGGDVSGIPWGDDVVEKNRIVRRQLPVLQEQDPNYVSSMPLEERKVYPAPELPELEPLPFAPDGWDRWDFRAFVEKQKRVRRERVEWLETQRQLGRFQYMHVDETTDVRMQNIWNEPRKQWSNEDIFNLITDNGNNALPTDVVVAVENPKTKADLQMTGGVYHESNEEFLERTGHLLHGDIPTREDDQSVGIDTNFTNDFEGLDVTVSGDMTAGGGGGVGGAQSLADVELENEIEEGMD